MILSIKLLSSMLTSKAGAFGNLTDLTFSEEDSAILLRIETAKCK